MIEHRNGRKFVRQYDSLYEIVQHLRGTARSWSQDEARRAPPYKSWDDGVGYKGALRLAAEGWPEGVRQIQAMAQLVSTGQLPTRSFDVAGDYPDVSRALGGDPRNMVRRGRVQTPRPTVTIAVNVCVNRAVDGTMKMNYGAALTGLVDRLESKGVRVELLCTDAAVKEGGQHMISTAWTVKRAQDTLDLSAIAFSVAHPAMARRLCFAMYEHCPSDLEMYGYGAPVRALLPEHFIDLPEDTLYLAGTHGAPNECRTLESAVKLVELQINTAAGDNIATLEALEAA